jgi:hypothetical protein
MPDELFETGVAIREEMFGPEHGRRKVEAADDFHRPFEDLVTNLLRLVDARCQHAAAASPPEADHSEAHSTWWPAVSV